MKKLLSTITVIAILGILAAVGFFGYNKYQEVELEKNKLQAQQKENEDSNSQNVSETSNNDNQSNESQNNSQEQSITEEVTKDEQQVTRDNVFDYLFAGINQNYEGGFDKSGHGSYVFEITSDGLVQTLDNAGGIEDSVQVNLD